MDIGIIGGSDGPTMILVSGSPFLIIAELMALSAVIFAVVLAIRHIIRRKK